jgi:hypothetical protein
MLLTFLLKSTSLGSQLEEERLINSDQVEELLNTAEDWTKELSQMQ